MDATYRNDLRELNELNFQRFDAKLEQRVTASEAWLRTEMQVGFAKLETGVARLETRLKDELAERFGSQMKWMFAYWVTTLITLGGLMVSLNQLGG